MSSQPVVATGLHTLLRQGNGDWHVVLDADGTTPPDVVLYDVLLLHDGDGADLDHLVNQSPSIVIAVGRDLRPDLESQALDRGARAVISLGVSGDELLEVVRAALGGTLHEAAAARSPDTDLPLGREVGLSRRESAVLRLIVQGYTNQEIADQLYLSINSIKTYIRTTYRKIGVSYRQQAVTWAIQHGFPIHRDEEEPTGVPDGTLTRAEQ
jgi:DNA-binding NarL/FixJ family response regulator